MSFLSEVEKVLGEGEADVRKAAAVLQTKVIPELDKVEGAAATIEKIAGLGGSEGGAWSETHFRRAPQVSPV